MCVCVIHEILITIFQIILIVILEMVIIYEAKTTNVHYLFCKKKKNLYSYWTHIFNIKEYFSVIRKPKMYILQSNKMTLINNDKIIY